MAAYAIALVFSFFYVNTLLKKGTLNVSGQKEEKKAMEVKPVKVKLIVQGVNLLKEYEIRKSNTDSVLDLLNSLRKSTDFDYGKTGYVDRNEIDHVYGIAPPEGYKWRIFFDDKDITQEFQNVYLTDESIYYIKLVKI